MVETIWVVPKQANLQNILSQLVLNAAEISQAEGASGATPNAKSNAVLTLQVNVIIAAVRTGGRVALSSVAGSVPPEAEIHAYVLTANALTASKPNLGTVVIGLNGGTFSPWNDLVKRANAWVDAVRQGKVPIPSAPSSPQQTGQGIELTNQSLQYNPISQILVSNLRVGFQYFWQPGPNEISLVCGTTTLQAAGGGQSFYASANMAVVTGTAPGLYSTGSFKLSGNAVIQGTAGDICGEVDMSTDGPPRSGPTGGYYDRWGNYISPSQHQLGTL